MRSPAITVSLMLLVGAPLAGQPPGSGGGSGRGLRGLVTAPWVTITNEMRAPSGRGRVTPTARGTGLVGPASQNRLSDARRLPDGRIVAAMCANQVRWLDTTGTLLGGWQEIDTPYLGQVRRVFSAGGDSVAVYEGNRPRLILFNGAMTPVRMIPLPAALDGQPLTVPLDTARAPGVPPFRSTLEVIGRLRDGRWVARVAMPLGREPAVLRQKVVLLTFDHTGRIVDTVRMDGPDVEVLNTGFPSALRYQRIAVFAATPEQVFVGTQDRASITRFGPTLSPAATIRT